MNEEEVAELRRVGLSHMEASQPEIRMPEYKLEQILNEGGFAVCLYCGKKVKSVRSHNCEDLKRKGYGRWRYDAGF